ncbi:PepSY-associated TM helix domain-containing protein [Pseudochryseolinea flava]|uniref:PepSY domain-containing protein n=1 Tax=Pseudochryseolinea flava TaxID=2059302 RepID=A0A364Y507_9BACT|nr:PepSY-associated TM helix domain-containing protein [Pseudochryseolinea flava]RAW02076.1 hypothetical protein DQQ10_05865 [Pseudochryseolinea flava]
MKKLTRSRAHRYIGLVLLPFLLISALTGFFRANYKWFWKEDYKKVKNTSYSYALDVPEVSMDSVFSIAKRSAGSDAVISEVRFRREAGVAFYDVRIKKGNPILIDATSGEVVSPIDENMATLLAGQYVKGEAKVKYVELNESYETRKGNNIRSVYIISYDDALETQIIIDKYNGEIEEEVDKNLKFGMWMVKLHDYDFWDSKRGILSFVGIGLTLVAITGFYLWAKAKGKKTKSKSQGSV